jgi:hypothetical protein
MDHSVSLGMIIGSGAGTGAGAANVLQRRALKMMRDLENMMKLDTCESDCRFRWMMILKSDERRRVCSQKTIWP